jgi:hypothetical protein
MWILAKYEKYRADYDVVAEFGEFPLYSELSAVVKQLGVKADKIPNIYCGSFKGVSKFGTVRLVYLGESFSIAVIVAQQIIRSEFDVYGGLSGMSEYSAGL